MINRMSQDFDSSEFLILLKRKDRSALEGLVKAYTGQIYNACLGLGFSAVEADDITQSVWLTFFDVVQGFEGRSKIRTFLFGILYNKASEHRKKHNKFDLNVDVEAIMDRRFDKRGHWVDGPIDPEKFLSASQMTKLISDCLDLLPLTQKMAFNLKEIQEETTAEICNILSVTATNLGVLLFRARNQLRECIEKKA